MATTPPTKRCEVETFTSASEPPVRCDQPGIPRIGLGNRVYVLCPDHVDAFDGQRATVDPNAAEVRS